MTTENVIKRLSILKSMDRNSKDFRELSTFLEKTISNINNFDLKDALMEKLTDICCQ